MKREEFLSTFGLGLAAICAGGCLAACGGKSSDGTSDGGGIVVKPPTSVNFTVNLATQITTVGEFLANSGVIVVRTATGNTSASFTAVQQACTHEGTSINYSASQGRFVCPNHGSQFTTAGAVINGPASASLKAYTVVIAGSTMTVTG